MMEPMVDAWVQSHGTACLRLLLSPDWAPWRTGNPELVEQLHRALVAAGFVVCEDADEMEAFCLL